MSALPPSWQARKPYVRGGSVGSVRQGAVLTPNQKIFLGLAAVLVGPAMLKSYIDKPADEKVDLSAFNIVTKYDTPGIEKLDNVVRIEFCES